MQIVFETIKKIFIKSSLPILIVSLLSSCETYKNVPYFKDFADTSKPILLQTVNFKSPVIQPDDVLTITIQTIDNDVTALLNSGNGTTGISGTVPVQGAASTGSGQAANGYLVDKEGKVEIPFVGKVKISGLTTEEAKEEIRKQVNNYFNEPVINVRFANYKITVLGEVAHPSSYIVPNEKVNIFDALGMAGDMTVFGRRENVLLVRDSLNFKKLVRLDLNSKDIITSPYFFLQPNDIVYVEPNKGKSASVDAYRNREITLIASGISLLTVIFVRLLFK